MKRTVVVAVSTLIAVASSAVGGAQAENDFNSVRAVGIISAIGDTLNVAENGAFDMHRGSYLLSIDDWQIDQHVVELLSRELASRFSVVPVSYDRGAFAQQDIGPFTFHPPPVHPLIAKLSAPVDAYLVVSKRLDQLSWQYGNDLGGLNIQRDRLLFRGDRTGVVLLIEIELIDARRNSRLAECQIDEAPSARIADTTDTFDPSLWPDAAHKLSVDQSNALHAQVISVLHPALRNCLTKMGLAGSMAP